MEYFIAFCLSTINLRLKNDLVNVAFSFGFLARVQRNDHVCTLFVFLSLAFSLVNLSSSTQHEL